MNSPKQQTMNVYIKEILKTTEMHKLMSEKMVNKNWSQIKTEVESFFSEIFQKDWKDVNEVSIFVPNIYPDSDSDKETQNMITYSKAIAFLWILDDWMEKHPELCDHWFNLYSSLVNPDLNLNLEKAFSLIVDELKCILTPYQLERYMKLMAIFFKTPKIAKSLANRDVVYSTEQYLDFRNDEGCCDILSLFLENLLNVNFNRELYENPLVREYHRLFGNHIIVVNDIFSSKREVSMNVSMNYINVFNTDGHSPELILQEMIDCMQTIFEKLKCLKIEIMENIPNFRVQYLDSLIDVMIGNYRWSTTCMRYNAKIFQDSKC